MPEHSQITSFGADIGEKAAEKPKKVTEKPKKVTTEKVPRPPEPDDCPITMSTEDTDDEGWNEPGIAVSVIWPPGGIARDTIVFRRGSRYVAIARNSPVSTSLPSTSSAVVTPEPSTVGKSRRGGQGEADE